MGANITIYCLEQLTDYFDFERLVHDIMIREGYSALEPLGGFQDKGRDAVHVSQSKEVTLFAYSVREDWRAKLAEDASKIAKHGHTCQKLVFVSTASFTAGERDEAIATIGRLYGWQLELYGLERLRLLLEAKYSDLRPLHPAIFPPKFLELESSQGQSSLGNCVFLSYDLQDSALADWLYRKLTAEGYLIWSERFKLLGGEILPNNVDDAIQKQSFVVVALYSNISTTNPEVIRQRMIAASTAKQRPHDFIIPVDVDGVVTTQLDRYTASLKFISLQDGWAEGLNQLLTKLETLRCPKPVLAGRGIAVSSLFEQRNLTNHPETVYGNYLRFHQIPTRLHVLEFEHAIDGNALYRLRDEWAHRRINSKSYISFHSPPDWSTTEFKVAEHRYIDWQGTKQIEGIDTENLITELLRKSLNVKCVDKGLKYSPNLKCYYFPPNLIENDRLKYRNVDGKKTFVQVVGTRTHYVARKRTPYRYHLAPSFWVDRTLFGQYVVIVQVRVHFTSATGSPLSKKSANSRRKHLTKDWWNRGWFSRTQAVCQFLADGDVIKIGTDKEEMVIVYGHLARLVSPLSIDETSLGDIQALNDQFYRTQFNDAADDEIDDGGEGTND